LLDQNYGTSTGSIVWAYSPCHPQDHDPSHYNEAWTMNPNGTITEIMTGMCLDTVHSTAFSQSPIVINPCTGVQTQKVGGAFVCFPWCCGHDVLCWFQWTWDSATKLIKNGVAVGFFGLFRQFVIARCQPGIMSFELWGVRAGVWTWVRL
jgi:hypothetical protein